MDVSGPNIDTNYNVCSYRSKNPLKFLVMCETCYQTNEQEYLNNYGCIFKETEKEGLIFIKKPEMDCYAGQKDENGEVLKQKNCRHCSPWKFAHNDNNREKCTNCGRAVGGSYFTGEGKTFCSLECIDSYKNKIPQPQKPPTIPPKNDNKDENLPKPITCSVCSKDISNQEATYRYKRYGGEEKNYCSLECFRKGMPTKNNPPQQEPPPKPQNINKGMSTEIKVVIGIGIILFISTIGLIGAKKKKKKREPQKNIILIYDHK
jgi:hypothetical protein